MRALDLIKKKRDGKELTPEEVAYLVGAYARGGLPDYQMAAFLMAAFLRGLSEEEAAALARAYVASGEVLDLSGIPGPKVDKHSTGGVGDKTSLVLVPLVAAAGVKFVKMSGRALGHTGGTLDKLASIPGMCLELKRDALLEQLLKVGAVFTGQTPELVPADKATYALRDATGTVESIPLIAASILSKKVAAGTDFVVFDVKVGSGSLLDSPAESAALAELLVSLGKRLGLKASAVLTAMDQPLGRAIGNALEVAEAVATLRGGGPRDLRELCLFLGSLLLVGAGAAASRAQGRALLESVLADGRAYAKLVEVVRAQGGRAEVLADTSLLPQARRCIPVPAPASGYVQRADARALGSAAVLLGAGRSRKEDAVDPAVGIVLAKKVGERVAAGEPLCFLHVNSEENLAAALELAAAAFTVGEERPPLPPLIRAVLPGCLNSLEEGKDK